jgi:hypothetical protein
MSAMFTSHTLVVLIPARCKYDMIFKFTEPRVDPFQTRPSTLK